MYYCCLLQTPEYHESSHFIIFLFQFDLLITMNKWNNNTGIVVQTYTNPSSAILSIENYFQRLNLITSEKFDNFKIL